MPRVTRSRHKAWHIASDCNLNTVVHSEEVRTLLATCGNVLIDWSLILQTTRRRSRHWTLQKESHQRHCLPHFVSLPSVRVIVRDFATCGARNATICRIVGGADFIRTAVNTASNQKSVCVATAHRCRAPLACSRPTGALRRRRERRPSQCGSPARRCCCSWHARP